MRLIAIDTNLLLLLLVGRVSINAIRRHKRLGAFDEDDYALLSSRIADAALFTIPNTMTETSNLLTQSVRDPLKSLLLREFRQLVEGVDELFVPSRTAVRLDEFEWLGLTDSAWLAALDTDTEFLTADLRLFVAAQERGLNAVNFNHLRDAG